MEGFFFWQNYLVGWCSFIGGIIGNEVLRVGMGPCDERGNWILVGRVLLIWQAPLVPFESVVLLTLGAVWTTPFEFVGPFSLLRVESSPVGPAFLFVLVLDCSRMGCSRLGWPFERGVFFLGPWFVLVGAFRISLYRVSLRVISECFSFKKLIGVCIEHSDLDTSS